LVAKAAFLPSWVFLNCFWLALVRRPAVAALLSLELVVALTLLSRFKFEKLWMTVDFVDVMIIDRDTSAFLLTLLPALRGWLVLTTAATAALLIAGGSTQTACVCAAASSAAPSAWPLSLGCYCRFRPICKRISSARTMFRNSRAPDVALPQLLYIIPRGWLATKQGA